MELKFQDEDFVGQLRVERVESFCRDRSRYDSWIGLWKTVVWGKGMQVHISLVIEY